MTKKRDCGECKACCILPAIKEPTLDKPAGVRCKNLKKEDSACDSCTIYKDRPAPCAAFKCLWLRGFGDENDRPDKSKVMSYFHRADNGTWIYVMELADKAHKTTGKNILIDTLNRVPVPIIVSDFNTPFGEDKGDYVIVSKELEQRTARMKGELLYKLNDDVTVYELYHVTQAQADILQAENIKNRNKLINDGSTNIRN